MRKHLTIKNVMTENPLTVLELENVASVVQKIRDNNFDHLPVVDEWKNLIGIISKSDVYQKALSLTQTSSGKSYANKVLLSTPASDIMSVNPVTVTSEHSIQYAIELLLQGDFHALPVTDNGKLVGIITSKDVLEFIVDEKVPL